MCSTSEEHHPPLQSSSPSPLRGRGGGTGARAAGGRPPAPAGELLSLASHSSVLVAGNLNAHHPMLQSPSPTNEMGRHLAVLLEDIPHIRLLYTGEATHTQGERLDLTLVSSDLAADAIWQASLDEWWADYQPPDDLHQQERDLTAAIQTAATTAIPMCAPSRRHQTDWWYYNDEVREHNHRVNLHRKLYKKRPNPSNLRLLQEVVVRAWQVSLRAKEDKWLEWCTTFSQHTSLGQMWRSVRTASGAAPPRPAAHPHPQQEAERLATTFTSRGSSDQLPLHTRRTQQQLQLHRDEAIREAMEVADMTDRPFSLQELQQAKRRGRDTATGADGVPYSMLAHAGPAGDTALEKCQDLGLKISAEKTRAMMLKAADPAWQLHVQGIDLAWTNSYQYLGVWVDKRLSFTTHATYLRERTQARLNVMRAMTRPTAGATFSVLRLYYVQAVRSLVDYSALVLLALSPNQQERLEVVQNTAMRTML
ncbi:hypothetical protein Pcinc_004449 [Petrolisthes cinctipes]|uniref:Endonuclease/exonuclease/phosphatase domain-containing protein n=1 Tax=Petrolisthes cinctipes TaxID=88211 RepID=A0AAE1L098_PETCI|nr:hypothetical protein Pcinc_004449 [Petrolisthes cinctipes]